MDRLNKAKNPLFLNSKVARKTFLTFVLCAIIPLLSISVISLSFVGRQLENEARQRLRQQCKNKGFYLYDRLSSLDNDLRNIADRYVEGFLREIEKNPYDPISREGSGWRRVFIRPLDGQLIALVEHVDQLPVIHPEELKTPTDDRTIIDIIHSDDISPAIFLTMYLDPADPLKGTITGEIDPIYLWGIGNTGSLLPEIDLSVIMERKKVLISSIPDYLISAEFLEAQKHDSFSGTFEHVYNGKTFINIYWSLFLNHRFSSPDWTIIFSQSKSSIMAPVDKFKYIYFLLVLLTLWVIMLLSIRAIQRRTVPIDKLKAGAMKIANGEFDYHVEVKSGDEYEELADTFNDMSSKLKKSQAMLLQAAKMSTLGQMGAGIVHEIGQPLGAISGYTELLQIGVSPEKHSKYLETIIRETARLREIIGKFRTFSRVSDEIFKPVYLSEILENTKNLMEHQLKVKRVRLDIMSADPLPALYGDKNGIQQVFLNLINNAVDATEDNADGKRNISIKAFSDNAFVHVEIADNGSGIPEEIQPSIFDPFFTTKGEEKGTGLGLSIIGTILHKHKATIKLTSKVNQGTCFKLSFPVISSENA